MRYQATFFLGVLATFVSFEFGALAAPVPLAQFQAQLRACQAWATPNMIARMAHHSGERSSGPQNNRIHFGGCETPQMDFERSHSFLIDGELRFNPADGTGVVAFNAYINAVAHPVGHIFPNGRGSVRISLDRNVQAARGGELSFLILQPNPHQTLRGHWTGTPEALGISASLSEVNSGISSFSEIERSANHVHPANDPNVNFETSVSLQVVSPEYCTATQASQDPTTAVAAFSSVEALRALVCSQLVPGEGPLPLEWSQRNTQIRPRWLSLKQIVQAGAGALQRFQNPALMQLLVQIANKQVRHFARWVHTHFDSDLARQEILLRDSSRMLASAEYPFSMHQILSRVQVALADQNRRDREAQEALEQLDSRAELFQSDANAGSLISRIRLSLSQPSLLSSAEIQTYLVQLQTESARLRTEADAIRAERVEYAAFR